MLSSCSTFHGAKRCRSFILGPDGKIVHAVFSSGKVGRLTASDALTIVNDLRK